MNYTILGPQNEIGPISDTEPTNIPEGMTVATLTDEQVAVVNALPKTLYFLIDGNLVSLADKIEADRIAYFAAKNTPIMLGQQWVNEQGYGADEKIICLNKLLKAQAAGQIASFPKLTATYTWLETVQAMAVQGAREFPPAPFTFAEIVGE